MKNLKLFFLSTLLATSGVGATSSTEVFDDFKMTQFNTLQKDTEMTFTINAVATNPVTVEIYIVNDLYKDGQMIFRNLYKSKQTEHVVYNNEYTYWLSNSIRIEYSVARKKIKGVYEHEVETVYGSTVKLNDPIYEYKSNAYYLGYNSTRGWFKTKQTITFKNFSDIYVPNYYHKIDLSNFEIESDDSVGDLTCSSANLTISNRNGVFNCFKHDEYYAEIPLTLLKKSTGKYVLGFNETLYVEPLTLKMSLFPEEGYVETEHLYFPRNEKRYENEYSCLILIKQLGMDCNNFSLNFKYKSPLNILGDCHNSEYCVRQNNS